MEFSKSKTEILKATIDRLQMYKIPPTNKISLEEFEDFAIQRLKGISVSVCSSCKPVKFILLFKPGIMPNGELGQRIQLHC